MSSEPRATVHLSHIVANWRTLAGLNPKADTAAVVKANAYGLGAERVSAALSAAGCETFFVAYPEEGAIVRKAVGAKPAIFVLNGPAPSTMHLFHANALTAVLNSDAQIRLWADAANLPCALHFDTGMNRLGLPASALETEGDALRALKPVLVMSHLACADAPDHAMNAAQLGAFGEIAAAFPGVPASLANSAGCYLGRDYGFQLTRPGIALYGGSTPPARVQIEHAVTLEAEILSVFPVKAGETVGYGATFTAKQDMLLATVGLGYADGILRSASNCFIGWLDGTPCPVTGRVTMDLITIDVSKAQRAAKAGRRVEFLGPHAKLEDQAARANTLGYELLTGIGTRVERLYP
ncbi:alanine racemase [Hyphomonas adhaerens]|uniref:alanine racemase n=1 Tax=Hyphomonas adhaerens TaxID=81029 RepID=UPI002353521F|nr:alanine racemase [Hyphomonas adhaerens]